MTLTCQVSPIYPDTEEEPLVRPEDVKEEVMRARGAGGQVSCQQASTMVLI